MALQVKRWIGPAPKECDICQSPIVADFVDGATKMGPWANMCLSCFKQHGVGLGFGKGQRYQRNDVFIKVEG